jgi:hypothetical protein
MIYQISNLPFCFSLQIIYSFGLNEYFDTILNKANHYIH